MKGEKNEDESNKVRSNERNKRREGRKEKRSKEARKEEKEEGTVELTRIQVDGYRTRRVTASG